jgi:hypothetical protein
MNRCGVLFGCDEFLGPREYSACDMDSVNPTNSRPARFIKGIVQQRLTRRHAAAIHFEKRIVEGDLGVSPVVSALWKNFEPHIVAGYVLSRWIAEKRKGQGSGRRRPLGRKDQDPRINIGHRHELPPLNENSTISSSHLVDVFGEIFNTLQRYARLLDVASKGHEMLSAFWRH